MASVTKFNPYHDENGRFTTSDGAATRAPRDVRGVEMVSPNVQEGLHIDQALAALKSDRHQKLMADADKIDQLVGIHGTHAGAIGAWADGAENTIIEKIGGHPTFDQIRTSAAMKGLIAEQKAVLPFQVDRHGKDALYRLSVASSDLKQLHQGLIKQGIDFHTLEPTDKGANVWVYDPGNKLGDKVAKVGDYYDTQIDKWRGHGEFLGSWDSREEGAKAYQATIDKNLGSDKLRSWSGIRDGWGAGAKAAA